jgi:hypothetical protein
MIDDFGDAIDALNRAARNLLEDASQLDDELKKSAAARNLDSLKSLTQKLCQGMQEVVGLLDPKSPVLGRFREKTEGVTYGAKGAAALKSFLDDHEKALLKAGVSAKAIEKLKRVLRSENKGGKNFVETDAKGMVARVRELQQLICNSAAFIDQLAGATDVLKGVVKGAMGVATIVVDITGLLTIPDVTGIVIFKAVKSTFVGGRMVYKAIDAIKSGFKKLRLRLKRIPDPPKAAKQAPQEAPPSPPEAPRTEPNYPRPTPEQRERFKLKPKPDDEKKE